jgi:hypothetical protein
MYFGVFYYWFGVISIYIGHLYKRFFKQTILYSIYFFRVLGGVGPRLSGSDHILSFGLNRS